MESLSFRKFLFSGQNQRQNDRRTESGNSARRGRKVNSKRGIEEWMANQFESYAGHYQ